MAMKTCKDCGSEISKSAKVCPKCGKKQKSTLTTLVIIIIVLLIIMGMALSGDSSKNSSNNSGTSQTSTEPENIEYISVDIDELEDALQNNAAAAKDNYKGKYLEITGKLSTIDSDLSYISIISTTKDFDLDGIQCYIKNEEQKEIVKTLSRDDTIIVKGKIKDVGEVLGYSLDITEISKY